MRSETRVGWEYLSEEPDRIVCDLVIWASRRKSARHSMVLFRRRVTGERCLVTVDGAPFEWQRRTRFDSTGEALEAVRDTCLAGML